MGQKALNMLERSSFFFRVSGLGLRFLGFLVDIAVHGRAFRIRA